jgi:predicted secreted hydrolase
MNKSIRWLAGLLVVALVFLAFLQRGSKRSEAPEQPPGLLTTPAAISGDFSKADRPRTFTFPIDQGPHPDFLTEWWYYTGNLFTREGRHFGYQLTFFRRALLPQDQIVNRASDLAANQVYLAHFVITDTQSEQVFPHERYSRGSAGLAGATGEPLYQVWLDDWAVAQTGENEYKLTAQQEGAALDLTLIDMKGPVLQGDQGYSPKGSEPGNASYYISQTRLETTGLITVKGESFQVSGLSWMDHEFSTSALGKGLVGWDWFSLQLSDGSEVMLFTLRGEDGSIDEFSSGTVIDKDGTTWPLARKDFNVEATGRWKSPTSGAEYPSGWHIQIPSEQLDLQIEPRIQNQELNLSFVYWEGAVQFSGSHRGTPVTGNGYIELTGYARSMQGQF